MQIEAMFIKYITSQKATVRLKQTTISTYYRNFETHIKNFFEDVQTVDESIITEFTKYLLFRVSRKTANDILTLLSSILRYNKIDIEIYKKGSTLSTTELLCSSESIVINYEGGTDIFKAIKCSDCQIDIVTKNVLNELYTGLGNNIYCIIKKNDNVIWYGFTVPCLYTTDFDDELNSLSLQFNDILSTLSNYNYEFSINETDNISSAYNIIKSIIKTLFEVFLQYKIR